MRPLGLRGTGRLSPGLCLWLPAPAAQFGLPEFGLIPSSQPFPCLAPLCPCCTRAINVALKPRSLSELSPMPSAVLPPGSGRAELPLPRSFWVLGGLGRCHRPPNPTGRDGRGPLAAVWVLSRWELLRRAGERGRCWKEEGGDTRAGARWYCVGSWWKGQCPSWGHWEFAPCVPSPLLAWKVSPGCVPHGVSSWILSARSRGSNELMGVGLGSPWCQGLSGAAASATEPRSALGGKGP